MHIKSSSLFYFSVILRIIHTCLKSDTSIRFTVFTLQILKKIVSISIFDVDDRNFFVLINPIVVFLGTLTPLVELKFFKNGFSPD